MKINVKNKTKKEWLELRKELGIGASEVQAVLNLDKYCPAFKLWTKKSGIDNEVEQTNKYMHRGTRLEEYVAEVFEYWDKSYTDDEFWQKVDEGIDKKRKIQRTSFIFKHDKYPVFASPDRLIYENGKTYCMEIKVTSSYGMKEEENSIKLGTVCQLQTQLVCVNQHMKVDGGYVVILEADTWNIRVFKFDYDEVVVKTVLDACNEFWSKVQKTKEAVINKEDYAQYRPESEATEKYLEYINEKVKTYDKTMVGSPELYMEAMEYKKLCEEKGILEKRITGVRAKIQDAMIGSETVQMDDGGEITEMVRYTRVEFEDDPNSYIQNRSRFLVKISNK